MKRILGLKLGQIQLHIIMTCAILKIQKFPVFFFKTYYSIFHALCLVFMKARLFNVHFSIELDAHYSNADLEVRQNIRKNTCEVIMVLPYIEKYALFRVLCRTSESAPDVLLFLFLKKYPQFQSLNFLKKFRKTFFK